MADKSIGLDLLPERFVNDFKKFCSLPVKTIKPIIDFFSGGPVDSLKEEEFRELARSSKLPATELKTLLSVVSFLKQGAVHSELDADTALAEIKEFASSISVQLSETKERIIRGLFEISPEIRKEAKSRFYFERIIPVFQSIETAHDLRAVFKDEDSNDILCFTPVVIVKIVVGETNNAEKDVIFQLSRQHLDSMIKILNTCKDKLESISESYTALL